jgi:hypothetical protein
MESEEVKESAPTAASTSPAPAPCAAATASKVFAHRASTLSIDAWSVALPSILQECTLSMMKDLILALGLKNKLGNVANTPGNLKDQLVNHLAKQRTLFSTSMTKCPKTRKTVVATCGECG